MTIPILLSLAPPQAADAAALAPAFQATGLPDSLTVVRPAKPAGFDGDLVRATQVRLSLAPTRLVPLGGGRFALLVLETEETGAHVDPGAVTIAYLHRDSGRWAMDGAWRELAWTGESGHPADAVQVLDHGAAPLLVLTGQNSHQGQLESRDWVVTLGASGPKLDGYFPAAGSLTAADCMSCGAYGYISSLAPATRPGALLSVIYRGWKAEPGRPDWRTPFTAQTDYAVGSRGLVALSPITLPS